MHAKRDAVDLVTRGLAARPSPGAMTTASARKHHQNYEVPGVRSRECRRPRHPGGNMWAGALRCTMQPLTVTQPSSEATAAETGGCAGRRAWLIRSEILSQIGWDVGVVRELVRLGASEAPMARYPTVTTAVDALRHPDHSA